MDFEIPQHPEDLESPRAGKLYVRAVLDVENCTNIDAVIDGTFTGLLTRAYVLYIRLTTGDMHKHQTFSVNNGTYAAYAVALTPCRSSCSSA